MRLTIPRAAHGPALAAFACALGVGALVLGVEPASQWLHSRWQGPADEWMRSSQVPSVTEEPAQAAAAEPGDRRKFRCPHCGFVESLAANATSGLYEVTVRLPDQTRHVFSDPDPDKWRPGQRIILIGGGHPPSR